MDFYKEYYQDNKFIGFIPCEKDREVIGFNGRIKQVAEKDIQIGKKRIKAGQEFMTILYPLCLTKKT